MSGYCHFEKTGNGWIDHILNMVTEAGNSFHHTMNWQESLPGEPSCIEVIDAAAKGAAEEIESLRTRLALTESVVEAVRPVKTAVGWTPCGVCHARSNGHTPDCELAALNAATKRSQHDQKTSS